MKTSKSVYGVPEDAQKTYSETYLAAVFIVEMAMMKPTIPTKKGAAQCQNRSPTLSECLGNRYSVSARVIVLEILY